MSSNDYIRIEWLNNNYFITHRDADTHAVYGKPKKAKTLEDAMRIVNTGAVEAEYGLYIKQKPK